MEGLEDLSRVLAQQCPPGFEEARLQVELDEGYAELRLSCRMSGGETNFPDPPGTVIVEVRNRLVEIQERMAHRGPTWTKCVVTVAANGRFRLDIEYPD